MQTFAFEWPARDDALCFGAINNFPRLADGRIRREVLAEQRRKLSPAPHSFHEDWLEGEGTDDFRFRISDFGFQICKFVGRFCETPFILASDTIMTSQMAVRSMVINAASNFSPACVPGAVLRWLVARRRSVLRAVVTAFLGGAGVMQVAAQTAIGTQPSHTSGIPVITATPEHVTVAGDSGSTEIHWDTGNGSLGFVFVTGTDQNPVLFASGPKGSQLVPWIRSARYVFELYGDKDRWTLLATVTVTGNVKAGAAPQTTLWRGRAACWLLVLVLFAIVYFAVYLSSTGTLRTTFPTEPTTSARPLYVKRNLLLGITAFVCLDGVIFHSGLYVSVLAPDSYAGRLEVLTRAEKQRPASGLKEVLVLGDSRMAEGFSTTVADALGSAGGFTFVNLTEPASTVSSWYYMLREVDPAARRYSAIVVPYGIGYEPSTADLLRISMVAPLLRYADCFNFASAFQRWSGRFRAFTACILRGSAYQSDVTDLLGHPIARIRSIQQEAERMRSRDVYKGREYDLVGTSYDPTTGQVTFAPKLTEAQRQAIRKSLIQPSQSDMEYSLKLQREWIPRILNRYSNSSTAIVLTPVPRGPFAELPGFSKAYRSILPSGVIRRTTFTLPEQTFDFLERPEYFFDAFHLNSKGRQRFTETLVSELVGRLRPADSKPDFNSRSHLTADRPRGSNEAN